MKVLVVGPSPDRSKGGMATVIKEIRDDVKLNSEFDIDIFESFVDGGKIKRLLFSVLAYVRFVCTKRNYDIYHIHAASRGSTFRKGRYVRIAKKWGKKVMLHIHGAQYMEFFQESSAKKKQEITDILNAADMVIALSEDWKRKFDATFDLKNCVVLKNGIDMDKLAPAITDPKEFRKSFLFLGRMGKRKGTYDLIDAVDIARKKVPDIKCYLAGDGEVEKVKSLIHEKELEKNIEVVGWADFEKKLDLLKKTSTVVLPSYNEGLPMSILEGMACGKAIISTTVGAIPEVVGEENGVLIDPGDVQTLAKAMVSFCENTYRVEKISRLNIQAIECEYSMKTMHKKLAEYYYGMSGRIA